MSRRLGVVNKPMSDIPVVGRREPCPCGSGKRYKACHGQRATASPAGHVSRPFAGLAGEGDWIALREIVPAATAPLQLTSDRADRDVIVATLLPMAVPALVRQSGQILLGMQTSSSAGDPSAELGQVLVTALDTEPGAPVRPGHPRDDAPRLQDLVNLEAPLDVNVHEGFDFWLEDDQDPSLEVNASLEQANAVASPTARLTSVDAAYWCQLGDRDQLRWVMPYDEEPLLDGLARLHADGVDGLGDGTRLLGTFRAHGRLVPVWDLAPGTTVDQVEGPAAALTDRLDTAVSDSAPLTAEQRRARAGLANRQVTLR